MPIGVFDWSVSWCQIHGGDFKMVRHVNSSVPCNDSSGKWPGIILHTSLSFMQRTLKNYCSLNLRIRL